MAEKQNIKVVELVEGVLKSSDLFNDLNEIIIQHNSDQYRLRVTSTGKLILTK